MTQKIGVLLLNLGTPDATDIGAVRRYLRQFLSDRRVIETPRLLWWPILNAIILTTRPRRSAGAYSAIWDRAKGDSPLRVITRAQSEKLASAFSADDRIIVDFAMRYGNPATGERLEALRARGCDRILLVPLYPQYSATTTASANDEAFRALGRMRRQPSVRTLPAYHDDPAYIDSIASNLSGTLGKLDFAPELVLASYHGLPKSYLEKGDPYHCFCQKTTRLVRERLGWPQGRLTTTFQSRFGPGAWLSPYTEETLKALPGTGVTRVAVIAPGFSADCLETLEELAIRGRDRFLAAGGERFAYIPCLNDSATGMRLIEILVRRELSGWV
ncbi:MAG: ferrochelatase [Cucumibacter sp.]